MATVFYERDAKPAVLQGKTIAIMGYGSQGHAQAQNLRDSGFNVIVGLDPHRQRQNSHRRRHDSHCSRGGRQESRLDSDSDSRRNHGGLFRLARSIGLSKGKVLSFSHGFGIHFKTIVPPPDVDVVMVAPKAQDTYSRRVYAKAGECPR